MAKMMGFDEPPLQKKYGNYPTYGEFPGKGVIKFRSKAEYNWALYCQWRKEQRYIVGWGYELQRIHFDDNSRGPRSYLPDFWITDPNGRVHIEEVKGFLEGRDRTKFRKWRNERPEPIHLILLSFTKRNANGRRLADRYCERIIDMRVCLKNLKGMLPFK